MNSELPKPPRLSVSVIVPTYREAENIAELMERVCRVRESHGLDMEVLIMDDDSGDGIGAVIAGLGIPWLRLVTRTGDRGLSAAVLDGFREASKAAFVVMDADLSHPPEKIPELLALLEAGSDFALGSRYVAGGSTDEAWGVFRWMNSRVATWLARPFTRVRDPMSGFFAIRRETWENAAPLNPIGYKIGLEMMVKGRCRNVRETPIHFSQRRHGKSKLTLGEQLRYLQHLRRLFVFAYGNWAHFAQFAVVGGIGTVVNLAVLTGLIWAGTPLRPAVAAAILVSMVSNFWLNRRFSFSYARNSSPWPQLAGFMAASSVGACVNYATVMGVLAAWPVLERVPQVASLAGIAAGLLFNYFVSRYFVFRKARS